MKWLEFIGVALRFGATAAEAVREARRRGDARPAKVVWREVQSKRAMRDAVRDARARLGLPERDE